MLCPFTAPPAIHWDWQLYHYGHVVLLALDMHLGKDSRSFRCVKIGAGLSWEWRGTVVWWKSWVRWQLGRDFRLVNEDWEGSVNFLFFFFFYIAVHEIKINAISNVKSKGRSGLPRGGG